MFDFVDNPANTIFDGSSGMGDDMTIISRERLAQERCPWLHFMAPPLGLLCEQLVTFGGDFFWGVSREDGEK